MDAVPVWGGLWVQRRTSIESSRSSENLRAVCSRRCEHDGVTSIPRAGSTPISTITGEPVKRVAVDATVADVAKALVAGDVGVVVMGDDARPAALVSERDVVRLVATGKDPAAVRAVDVASTKLVCGVPRSPSTRLPCG
jgi:hypothetical protein